MRWLILCALALTACAPPPPKAPPVTVQVSPPPFDPTSYRTQTECLDAAALARANLNQCNAQPQMPDQFPVTRRR